MGSNMSYPSITISQSEDMVTLRSPNFTYHFQRLQGPTSGRNTGILLHADDFDKARDTMLDDQARTDDLIKLLERRVLGEAYDGFAEAREWDRQVVQLTYHSEELNGQCQPMEPTSAAHAWRSPAAHDLISSIIDKHFRAAKEAQRLRWSHGNDSHADDEVSGMGKASSADNDAAEEEVQEQWKQDISRLTAKVHEMFIARLEASHGAVVENEASA
ncbi:MAG: hypothetical protein Q9207_003085 [Kuettlingeria erythrocarpa]